MNPQQILERYVQLCVQSLSDSPRLKALLCKSGLREGFLYDSFRLGYAEGGLVELVKDDPSVVKVCEQIGLLKNGKEVLSHRLVIPVLDEDKGVVNIAGYSLHPVACQLSFPNIASWSFANLAT